MTLPTPVSSRLSQELQNCLRDVVRRAVDGTVIPLFVDNSSKRVLIGTVKAIGPDILQVSGDATITGLLKTGNLWTGSISASGEVWAGSLISNGTLQAQSLIVSGPSFLSGPVQNLILMTADGKHTARVCLDAPDSTGAMGLRVDALT